MKLKIYIASILCTLLPSIAMGQGMRQQDIDPLDTLDEEELQAIRDTVQLPRRNMAKYKTDQIDLKEYVLNDRYSPSHHTFDHHWYDHLYVGAGMGFSKIVPQNDDYRFKTMTQLNLHVGKQFTKRHALRLSLGGGWGYQQYKELWLAQASAKLDYLFNLSTQFFGYNPARRVETSLMFGVGGNYTWMKDSEKQLAPEAHFGVQLKCFTGPLGTINLEPYVGIGSDKMDLSGTRNWHGYDIFYGVNVNYSFFFVDNLSKEARLQLLQSRMADDRLVTPQTLEKWRTPWFVEAAMGPVVSSSDYLSRGKTMGHQVSLGVGRWLSPVMGFRLSAISRSTKWYEETVERTAVESTNYPASYNKHYISGRIEALLNPFGFFRSFRWDAPYGAYLTFGTEFGMLTQYKPNEDKTRVHSEAYGVGVHLWGKLTEDLQAFIEPRYTYNVYTVPYNNVKMRQKYGENSFGINIGLTMMIRSEKFHDLYEMDHTQNYTYRHVRGTRIGVAGGLSLLQKRNAYYTGGGVNWNGMVFAEYRFNHLHSVRFHADFLNLSNNHVLPYTVDGRSIADNNNGLFKVQNRLLIGALNYEVSLTNLCSGRLRGRKFELEGFIGPAVGYLVDQKATYAGINDYTGSDVKANLVKNDDVMIGADAGLKLTTYVGKGFSIFFTPTIYLLNTKNELISSNTVGAGKFRLYETLNLGVQYKVGKFRLNPEKAKVRRLRRQKEWTNKQIEKTRAWQDKQQLKQEKRRARYEKRRRR
ncbi:MAG: hypothetical protein J6W24_06745 [Prevotella sp.]|nr:hypothetical protein [Prevotella sp.]